jgi:hypothetical protein
MSKATTRKEFEEVFPTLVEDILALSKQYGVPEQALEWYKDVRNNFLLFRDTV